MLLHIRGTCMEMEMKSKWYDPGKALSSGPSWVDRHV